MIGFAAALLTVAWAADDVKWLDDNRVEVTTVQNIKGDLPDFAKAGETLKQSATSACAGKSLGEPEIEGEVMVSRIGVTPAGQRQVTLVATYTCGQVNVGQNVR